MKPVVSLRYTENLRKLHGDGTGGNEHELLQGKFRLDMRNTFFTVRANIGVGSGAISFAGNV